ncbi:MAG: BatA domain-containing protein [Burkholderiales bacterium]|nr:BatA domain-containing protein [Burkholderiales bacterium]
MRFAAYPPLAAWALLIGVAVSIMLLYLLRARPARLAVSSTLLWSKIAATHALRFQRWRWLLSLLLALLIGLSIALALTRPEATHADNDVRRLVLVLDNSPSMAARTTGGATRWEHAVHRAALLMKDAGPAREFLVLDTMGQRSAGQFIGAAAALTVLEALTPTAVGEARMPVLPREPGTLAYLLTDGVADFQAGQVLRDPPVRTQSVFEPADNAAITAFDVRAMPHAPTQHEAFVRVFNASASARRITLVLDGAEFGIRRVLEIGPGESSNQFFDVSAFRGSVLRATAVMDGDAFALDDMAYAVTPTHTRTRVLLVTPGSAELEAALGLLAGVQLTVVAPAAYRESAEFDAYVFDRFTPTQAPAGGALVFASAPASWLSEAMKPVKRPVITRWDETFAFARPIAWDELRVERATLGSLPSGGAAAAVVLGYAREEGALISAKEGSPRAIHAGFALRESNLALQAGFPVFLAAALDWIAASNVPLRREAGAIEVTLREAEVYDRNGRRLDTFATTGGTGFVASASDVFTSRNRQGELQIVTGPRSEALSAINRTTFADDARPQEEDRARTASAWSLQPAWLLGFALFLLLLEWFGYTRRVTV